MIHCSTPWMVVHANNPSASSLTAAWSSSVFASTCGMSTYLYIYTAVSLDQTLDLGGSRHCEIAPRIFSDIYNDASTKINNPPFSWLAKGQRSLGRSLRVLQLTSLCHSLLSPCQNLWRDARDTWIPHSKCERETTQISWYVFYWKQHHSSLCMI